MSRHCQSSCRFMRTNIDVFLFNLCSFDLCTLTWFMVGVETNFDNSSQNIVKRRKWQRREKVPRKMCRTKERKVSIYVYIIFRRETSFETRKNKTVENESEWLSDKDRQSICNYGTAFSLSLVHSASQSVSQSVASSNVSRLFDIHSFVQAMYAYGHEYKTR